jgi:hypothetical protein
MSILIHVIDPRDGVADLGFDFHRREDELVDRNLNRCCVRRDGFHSPYHCHKYEEIQSRQHVMSLTSVQRRLVRRAADAPGRF